MKNFLQRNFKFYGGFEFMNNFIKIKADILKNWSEFKQQTDLAFTNSENRKHRIFLMRFLIRF